MGRFAVIAFPQHSEKVGHDTEGGRSGEEQPADDGPRQGGVLLLTRSSDCHWDHTDNHCGRRHQHRPDPCPSCSNCRIKCRCACKLLLTREGDKQNGVSGGDADRHDCAHQRGHAKSRAGDKEHGENAAECGRQCQDNDERVAEVLVVHDHEHIDEDRGEEQPDAQIVEGIIHALDLAYDLNRIARRELFLQLRDDAVDVFGDTAEIAGLDVGVDLVDRLDVGLVRIGRNRVTL